MASTRVSRNEVDPQGNRKTFTLSQWIKRTELGVEGAIFSHRFTNAYYFHIRFNTDDTFKIEEYSNSSQTLNLQTNRKFRDPSAWYHIVVAMDTTQATDSNRMKLYVNGVQETSLSAVSYPSQNLDLIIDGGAGYASHYGDRGDGGMYFGGVISHAHYTQGTAYDASYFGETDSTTGEWKIKTSPSVTYGTKGYFIFKDGNSVTDQSGNSNNFSVGAGTFTNTEDCPSNVFATWNPLEPELSYKGTYSNGNTTVATTTTGGTSLRGSIAIPYTGKWYWENKVVSTSGTIGDNSRIGIATGDSITVGSNVRYMSDGQKTVDATASSYGATYGAGDIIGVAVDSDNNTVEFFKNGVSQGSISYTMDSSLTYKPYISENSNTISITFSTNFGNGYFGTTAVSSAGTNASGIGIFEYDVPTGYTALSTKGLNE